MADEPTAHWTRVRRSLATNLERVGGGIVVTGPLERLAVQQSSALDRLRPRNSAPCPATDDYRDDAA